MTEKNPTIQKAIAETQPAQQLKVPLEEEQRRSAEGDDPCEAFLAGLHPSRADPLHFHNGNVRVAVCNHGRAGRTFDR